MTAPDPAAGLDDAAIEALLGDVDALDKDTDAPPADWKPLTYAEQRALEGKLSKANNSAKNIRLKLASATKATPAAILPKPGSPAAGGQPQNEPAPVDAAKLRAEIEAEYKTKQEAAAVQTAAVTALVAAGLKLPADKRTVAVRRAVKLLELDGVSADDSAAMDAAIDEVKASWPGLFGSGDDGSSDKSTTSVKSHQRRLGGPSASAGTGSGGQALTSAELLAQKIFGK